METNNIDDFVAVTVIVPGKQGKTGEKGEDGKDGADGKDGKDGKDGIVENLNFAQIKGNPSDNESLVAYIESKLQTMLLNGNDYEF